ncbi:hypothetical protein GCM10017559_71090 [Streptosporangium longisporum]|uniref:ABC transporter domain-containing protein n=1 Tax=Streptosporangium longisporum TaxID=46187 RepID=A0ABP6L5N4_9ACTN
MLLLDEPTTALDLGHQQQVLELVDRLRLADGLTVVTTLHDLSLAGQYADAMMLLSARPGGPPRGFHAEVLTEELIAEHFEARVRVGTGPAAQARGSTWSARDDRADPGPTWSAGESDADPGPPGAPVRATPVLSHRHEDGARLACLLWEFGPGWRAISSAVLGGGIGPAAWALNAQVVARVRADGPGGAPAGTGPARTRRRLCSPRRRSTGSPGPPTGEWRSSRPSACASPPGRRPRGRARPRTGPMLLPEPTPMLLPTPGPVPGPVPARLPGTVNIIVPLPVAMTTRPWSTRS